MEINGQDKGSTPVGNVVLETILSSLRLQVRFIILGRYNDNNVKRYDCTHI